MEKWRQLNLPAIIIKEPFSMVTPLFWPCFKHYTPSCNDTKAKRLRKATPNC